jgi:cellulose synthase/poly-beta-1,6-N-acetylglucosamine synthase-like glycosyltransferase
MIYLVLSALAILLGIFGLLDGIRSARHIRTFRPKADWRPRVLVICPCKGIDSEFRDNAASVLNQDYPNLRVIFVVEAEDDPAVQPLKQLGATVLVAGIATVRGQKVHNLIHAVEHAAEDSEVFAFCDSDARYPSDWISNLIPPLEDETVGVSTGYRWYMAEPGSSPSIASASAMPGTVPSATISR